MAFNDLYSINNYTGNSPIRRLSSSRRDLTNRTPSNKGNGFQNILAAFQTRNSDIAYKTRGLTISDYRARPVISKSRFRPRPIQPAMESKNTNTEQLSDHWPASVIEKDLARTRSLSGLKATNINGAKNPKGEMIRQKARLTEQQIIDQQVNKAAAKYNLPPKLLISIIRAESNFKVKAVSAAGARGLMQLMPATAKELGVRNSFDIEQNIGGGAKYLRKMLNRFGGNIKVALAAYNAGPGTVSKYDGQVPYPETRQYVKRVLRFSRQIA